MNNEGKRLPDDKEEYIKIIKPLFDEITKNTSQHLMNGFKFMASQLGSKGVIGGSSSSQSEENKTMGGHIFSSTGPHNRPHEFQSTPRPTAPKFLLPKEETNIQFELDTMTKEWGKLDEDCKISIPFDQYFIVANKLKKKEDNRSLYQKKIKLCHW